MAFDFPNSPTIGQVFQGYTWDGEKWNSATGIGAGNIYVGDVPPASTTPVGSLWWQSSTGFLFVNYNDGNSIQWVAIAQGSGSLVTSIAGNVGAFTLGAGLTNLINDLRVALPTFVSYLAADVNLTTANTWFDGPSIAQGTTGIFFVLARAACADSGGAAPFSARLTDGTNVYDTPAYFYSTVANGRVSQMLAAIVINPVANLKLQVQDNATATGKLTANVTGAAVPRDTFIMAVRVG